MKNRQNNFKIAHLHCARKFLFFTLLGLTFSLSLTANGQDEKQEPKQEPKQEQEKEGYAFTVEKSLECTDVKSQGRTGTCWSFATASFVESELIRMNKGRHNISEMFVVRNVYKDKAQNYILRQGKANFSEGALAHDLMNAIRRHGLVPEESFSGLQQNSQTHDHSEMAAILQGMVEAIVKRKPVSPKWKEAYARVLDVYMGQSPQQFTYKGETYTPQSFAKSLGFNAKDYVNLTSYTHHPFNESFVLEIPDNYSNGSFQNVPIDDLVKTIDNAINNGYTVAWDGDVSENGFASRSGMAILPKQRSRRMLKEPVEEQEVTQEMRQKTFENFSTTDDHLMHLVGIARDKNGKKYYIIKNSWGDVGPFKGYLYMSEAYVRLKTVAIMVHKNALPQEPDGSKVETDENSDN